MLTAGHEDELEKKNVRDQWHITLRRKGQVNAIVMGDFNRIVEEGSTYKAVGPFGLSRRN